MNKEFQILQEFNLLLACSGTQIAPHNAVIAAEVLGIGS